MVFAVACRFSRNERRVAPDPTNYRQAGEEYYEDVRSFYSRLQNPITLIQFQGLAVSTLMANIAYPGSHYVLARGLFSISIKFSSCRLDYSRRCCALRSRCRRASAETFTLPNYNGDRIVETDVLVLYDFFSFKLGSDSAKECRGTRCEYQCRFRQTCGLPA